MQESLLFYKCLVSLSLARMMIDDEHDDDRTAVEHCRRLRGRCQSLMLHCSHCHLRSSRSALALGCRWPSTPNPKRYWCVFLCIQIMYRDTEHVCACTCILCVYIYTYIYTHVYAYIIYNQCMHIETYPV